MPLSPSWKTHFLQGLATANAIGDCNTKKFTKAMIHDAAVDTKMKYLNKDHSLILVADNKKQVIILYNLKNLRPTNTVAALFGLGPDTQVVALDVNTAIATQSKCTQPAANIIASAPSEPPHTEIPTSTDSACSSQPHSFEMPSSKQ